MTSPSIHLLVEHPDVAPRLVAVAGATAVVGRHESCAVVLDDEQVSRQHAEFTIHPDRVSVRDLGSRNGTYVDGALVVGDVAVTDDALITIGRARLAVRTGWTASTDPTA